jgi:hypothetical protein
MSNNEAALTKLIPDLAALDVTRELGVFDTGDALGPTASGAALGDVIGVAGTSPNAP